MLLSEAQVLTTVYDTVSAGRVRDIAPYVHPLCEFRDPAELPDSDCHVGREAVVSYLEEWVETWSVLRISIEEFQGAHGRLGAWVQIDLRGAASGVTTEMHLFQIVEFEDGMIRRVRGYLDRADGIRELVGDPGETL